MGELSTSSLDSRTAPLQVRPNASAALRASDPVKERLLVGEDGVPRRQDGMAVDDQAAAFNVDADESAGVYGGQQQASSAASAGGRGLLGAFTNFLSKIFGQGDGNGAASTRLAGMDAYGRATAQQATTLSGLSAELQTPGLPRLASGRVLDLTV